MKDCVYCEIARKKRDLTILHEDEQFLVFLEENPACYGHLVLIPKEHDINLMTMDADKAAEMMRLAQQWARNLCRSKTWDGANIRLDVGECAGQAVSHCSVHIIPRVGTDGFFNNWRKLAYDSTEHRQEVIDDILKRAE